MGQEAYLQRSHAPVGIAISHFSVPTAESAMRGKSFGGFVNVEELEKQDCVINVEIYMKQGTEWRGLSDDLSRPGFVMTTANTPEEAIAMARCYSGETKVHIKANDWYLKFISL